jgi:predicted RNA-binding protein with PUA-like domain
VPKPVTLAEIKATKSLKDMVLVNNSRLSVQPVSAEEWGIVSRMAGLKGI